MRGACGELADRKPGMMTLISLGDPRCAFGTSLAATLGLFEIEVWWELASLITDYGPRPLAGNAGYFRAHGALECTRRIAAGHCRRVRRRKFRRFPLRIARWRHCPRPARNLVPADGTVSRGARRC